MTAKELTEYLESFADDTPVMLWHWDADSAHGLIAVATTGANVEIQYRINQVLVCAVEEFWRKEGDPSSPIQKGRLHETEKH